MRVACPNCKTAYNVDDAKIPATGANLKCAKCKASFPVKKEAVSSPAASSAVPLPGGAASARPPAAAPARTSAVPLPGEAASAPAPARGPAIPLPGGGGPVPAEARGPAVPLPGAAAPAARKGPVVPLPAPAPAPLPDLGTELFQDQTVVAGGNRPLEFPDASAPQASEEFNPFELPPPPPPGSADPFGLPPPQEVAAEAPAEGFDPFGLPPPQAAAAEAPAEGFDPYGPPPAAQAPAFAFDPFSASAPQPEAPAALAAMAPPPAASSAPDMGFEVLGDAPAEANAQDPFGSPQGGDPFAAMAPPPPSSDLGFDLPPAPIAPPASAPAAFDDPFGPPPPSPRAAPPAPAATPSSLAFGEVDFGAPPPAPSAPPFAAGAPGSELDFLGFDSPAPVAPPPVASSKGEDSLEFDPIGSKAKAGGDDLEADLSAPLPSPSVPAPPAHAGANDLELLDFIDDASAGIDSGKKLRPGSQRYQIRRKSGKVFGPFEQPVVVKMLQEGQLLGNEDVTCDGGEGWVPIGSIQAFGEAIQKLMESPGGVPGLSSSPTETASPTAAADEAAEQALERMKALYGDRMAAIAIVDSAAAEQKFKKRLPLIVGGAIALVVLAIGISGAFTPYGAFGLSYLFPTRFSKGGADYAKFQEASKLLTEDTFNGYRRALAESQSLLKTKEAVEARALFVQSVFYLKRRYFAADEHLKQAQKYLEELELAVKNDVEVVKARAGAHLLKGEGAQIRPVIEQAIVKNSSDLELLYLLAETHLQERNTEKAAATLNRGLALDPKCAKFLHALGFAKTLEKTPDYAAARDGYQKAIDADARHLSSAVEMAAISVQKLDEPEKAAEALRRALSEEGKKVLSPADQARAHYLMGMLLASRHQREEAVKEFEEALKSYPESAPARAAFGRFVLRRHDYAKAVELFEAAYKSDSKEIEYLDGLVRGLLGSGAPAKAQKLVTEAAGSFPGNPRVAFLAGLVADAIEKGDDAERNYKRAAQADLKQWEPLVLLGEFHLRRKRPEEAKLAFSQALERAPNIPDTHVGQGNYLLVAQSSEEAKAEFLQALKLDAENPGAHFGMAQVLESEGSLQEARKEYELVVQLDPATPRIWTRYGTLLWNLKALDEASQALEKAKNVDPKDATATSRLGAVYFDQGKLAEALKNAEAALSLDPSDADAYYTKARVHFERHENNQAIESIKSALERSSKRPELHALRGNIMYQANKFADAVDSWQQAVKIKADYADPLESLARGFHEQGDWNQAIGYYEKTMEVDPQRKRLLMNVAEALFAQNLFDKSIQKFQKALEVDPENSKGAYYKIGRCYDAKGRTDQAIKYYLEATQNDPEAREVWRFLGYAYKEKKKNKDAKKAFEEYLRLAPDAGDRKEIETEIYDLTTER
ncbi:MAG: zinc-ribbon domain-containing protein [Deltaproteobacteria bacterium]|nr:zinc-ribbon domain-containing protein [Deltaproteobacteria bacterium]